MKVDISADIRPVVAQLQAVEKQARFGVSKGLNRLANMGQGSVRERTGRVFNVKQKTYMDRSIYRKPGDDFATKQKQEAAVRVDERRNQYAKWERGGFKTAIKGKQRVAVPSRDIKRTKKGLVPRSLYPAAFKPFTQATNLKSRGGRQVQDVGQKNTFFVRTKQGTPLLVQRVSRRRLRGLWLFVRQTRLDRRLEFAPTIMRVVKSRAREVMKEEIAHALATAR